MTTRILQPICGWERWRSPTGAQVDIDPTNAEHIKLRALLIAAGWQEVTTE